MTETIRMANGEKLPLGGDALVASARSAARFLLNPSLPDGASIHDYRSLRATPANGQPVAVAEIEGSTSGTSIESVTLTPRGTSVHMYAERTPEMTQYGETNGEIRWIVSLHGTENADEPNVYVQTLDPDLSTTPLSSTPSEHLRALVTAHSSLAAGRLVISHAE